LYCYWERLCRAICRRLEEQHLLADLSEGLPSALLIRRPDALPATVSTLFQSLASPRTQACAKPTSFIIFLRKMIYISRS
jgi:hypothetical protein